MVLFLRLFRKNHEIDHRINSAVMQRYYFCQIYV